MTEDDLKKRTKLFARRILKLVAALPKTLAGRTIRGVNWRDLEPLLRPTIERLVVPAQRQNSFPG